MKKMEEKKKDDNKFLQFEELKQTKTKTIVKKYKNNNLQSI